MQRLQEDEEIRSPTFVHERSCSHSIFLIGTCCVAAGACCAILGAGLAVIGFSGAALPSKPFSGRAVSPPAGPLVSSGSLLVQASSWPPPLWPPTSRLQAPPRCPPKPPPSPMPSPPPPPPPPSSPSTSSLPSAPPLPSPPPPSPPQTPPPPPSLPPYLPPCLPPSQPPPLMPPPSAPVSTFAGLRGSALVEALNARFEAGRPSNHLPDTGCEPSLARRLPDAIMSFHVRRASKLPAISLHSLSIPCSHGWMLLTAKLRHMFTPFLPHSCMICVQRPPSAIRPTLRHRSREAMAAMPARRLVRQVSCAVAVVRNQ